MGRAPVSSDLPYAIIAFTGLLPWRLFATSLTQGSVSLVENRQMVTKVYFPRMLLPMASIFCALVDFAIAMVVLVGLMLWFAVAPGPAIATLPLFLLLTLLACLGAGLWLAALNALYRDFTHVVPFLVQTGLFVSPVVYQTAALIPERWRLVYALNPLVGPLEGFRWALIGAAAPPLGVLIVSLASTLILVASGTIFFRRVEHVIADRI